MQRRASRRRVPCPLERKPAQNDRFVRSQLTLGGTQPLVHTVTPGATRPLLARGTALVAGTWDEVLLAHALEALDNTAERMELLAGACQAAGLPIPGVTVAVAGESANLKIKRLAAYLTPVLASNPTLSQAVQVSLFRFQQLGEMVGWRQALRPPPPEEFSMLRRLLYYLSNLDGVFKGDRVLSALFPHHAPNGVLETSRRLAKLSPQLVKQRDQAHMDALALEESLAPSMRLVREVLMAHEAGAMANLGDVLNPARTKIRLLALSLTGQPSVVARLRGSYEAYCSLQTALRSPLESEGDVRGLRALVFPLGRLEVTFHDHPTLRLLFS
jgi:hypothetical protein